MQRSWSECWSSSSLSLRHSSSRSEVGTRRELEAGAAGGMKAIRIGVVGLS